MRVIVTGATSFIGQAAVKELLRRGCQVTAVVRPDSPGLKAISRKPGVEVAAVCDGKGGIACSTMAGGPS